MKEYVIPYIVGKQDEWWAGIDIYNHNPDSHQIIVSIYKHFNGKIANTFEINLRKYSHHLILPDDINEHIKTDLKNEGRATVIIRGPDNLMITPFQASNKGFGILPYPSSKL